MPIYKYLFLIFRDLEIVRQKNELRLQQNGPEAEAAGNKIVEFKDITDLAALPVADAIDVKLQHPYCELCGEEFKNSVNKARDKSVHLMGHFREEIMKDLPSSKPFKCPKCTFLGKDSLELSRHYGLNHKVSRFAIILKVGTYPKYRMHQYFYPVPISRSN